MFWWVGKERVEWRTTLRADIVIYSVRGSGTHCSDKYKENPYNGKYFSGIEPKRFFDWVGGCHQGFLYGPGVGVGVEVGVGIGVGVEVCVRVIVGNVEVAVLVGVGVPNIRGVDVGVKVGVNKNQVPVGVIVGVKVVVGVGVADGVNARHS